MAGSVIEERGSTCSNRRAGGTVTERREDAAGTAATTAGRESGSTCSNRRAGGTVQPEREDAADTAATTE